MPNAPHILIVDDDKQIRTSLTRFLTANGFRISAAEDGVAMFAAVAKGRFDLIVLDIMMPGEDGLTVCRRLREASRTPGHILNRSIRRNRLRRGPRTRRRRLHQQARSSQGTTRARQCGPASHRGRDQERESAPDCLLRICGVATGRRAAHGAQSARSARGVDRRRVRFASGFC